MCAGTSFSNRAICPKTEMRRAARMSLRGVRPVRARTSMLLTKSNQRIPNRLSKSYPPLPTSSLSSTFCSRRLRLVPSDVNPGYTPAPPQCRLKPRLQQIQCSLDTSCIHLYPFVSPIAVYMIVSCCIGDTIVVLMRHLRHYGDMYPLVSTCIRIQVARPGYLYLV